MTQVGNMSTLFKKSGARKTKFDFVIGTPLQTNLICPIGCVQAQIEKDIKSWHDCIAAIMPGAACFVNSPGYPGQVVGVSLAPLSGVVPV